MIASLFHRVFGTKNSRELKRMGKVVDRINALEPRFQELTDAQLQACTGALRERAAAGASLDALLPEAFAAVREAARRSKQMRHFDVQLIGGIALHEGRIAEMRTGEGKTLVATLAAYLNAITGRGVHIVTVNDYLARRDANWMGPIYAALGLTVGVAQSGQAPPGETHRLSGRHHLRHQQRVRLRLPARQHGLLLGGQVSARPALRHRR